MSYYHDAVRQARRSLIAQALVQCGGNRTHAAKALGLQRTHLQRLVRTMGLEEVARAARRRGASPPS